MTNRRIVLATRPTGMVDDTTTRLEHGPVPEPGPGQALVAVRYLSMDPTIRTWMDARRVTRLPSRWARSCGAREWVRSWRLSATGTRSATSWWG